jgi:hypothetical protein
MPALSPALAVGYLAELSTDVRAALVLDAAGSVMAGPHDAAEAARELLAAAGDASEIEVRAADGIVFGARSATHAVVVVCGSFALSGLQRHDLRTVLADLAEPTGDAAEVA